MKITSKKIIIFICLALFILTGCLTTKKPSVKNAVSGKNNISVIENNGVNFYTLSFRLMYKNPETQEESIINDFENISYEIYNEKNEERLNIIKDNSVFRITWKESLYETLKNPKTCNYNVIIYSDNYETISVNLATLVTQDVGKIFLTKFNKYKPIAGQFIIKNKNINQRLKYKYFAYTKDSILKYSSNVMYTNSLGESLLSVEPTLDAPIFKIVYFSKDNVSTNLNNNVDFDMGGYTKYGYTGTTIYQTIKNTLNPNPKLKDKPGIYLKCFSLGSYNALKPFSFSNYNNIGMYFIKEDDYGLNFNYFSIKSYQDGFYQDNFWNETEYVFVPEDIIILNSKKENNGLYNVNLYFAKKGFIPERLNFLYEKSTDLKKTIIDNITFIIEEDLSIEQPDWESYIHNNLEPISYYIENIKFQNPKIQAIIKNYEDPNVVKKLKDKIADNFIVGNLKLTYNVTIEDEYTTSNMKKETILYADIPLDIIDDKYIQNNNLDSYFNYSEVTDVNFFKNEKYEITPKALVFEILDKESGTTLDYVLHLYNN